MLASNVVRKSLKETLIKLITFMVRQAHHERNQYITVRPKPVEGLNQSFLNFSKIKIRFVHDWHYNVLPVKQEMQLSLAITTSQK